MRFAPSKRTGNSIGGHSAASTSPHFDRLFEHAREHADAAGYLNHQEPEVTLLVSVVLEQEKRIRELHARIRTLEREADITAGNERERSVATGSE